MTDVTLSPNIVREFTVERTHIKIADDCCRNMTAEDVKKALCEIARTAQRNIAAAAVGNSEENETADDGGGAGYIHGDFLLLGNRFEQATGGRFAV